MNCDAVKSQGRRPLLVCERALGHEGVHRDPDGTAWVGDPVVPRYEVVVKCRDDERVTHVVRLEDVTRVEREGGALIVTEACRRLSVYAPGYWLFYDIQEQR